MASLILTVVGPDRPGLVRALAEAVAARNGSWLESRMARLAGQFAGIVLVEAPDALLDDLRTLENQGLRITVQSGTQEAGTTGTPTPPTTPA
jgi:glycine cleavage system regulatory protein